MPWCLQDVNRLSVGTRRSAEPNKPKRKSWPGTWNNRTGGGKVHFLHILHILLKNPKTGAGFE